MFRRRVLGGGTGRENWLACWLAFTWTPRFLLHHLCGESWSEHQYPAWPNQVTLLPWVPPQVAASHADPEGRLKLASFLLRQDSRASGSSCSLRVLGHTHLLGCELVEDPSELKPWAIMVTFMGLCTWFCLIPSPQSWWFCEAFGRCGQSLKSIDLSKDMTFDKGRAFIQWVNRP